MRTICLYVRRAVDSSMWLGVVSRNGRILDTGSMRGSAANGRNPIHPTDCFFSSNDTEKEEGWFNDATIINWEAASILSLFLIYLLLLPSIPVYWIVALLAPGCVPSSPLQGPRVFLIGVTTGFLVEVWMVTCWFGSACPIIPLDIASILILSLVFLLVVSSHESLEWYCTVMTTILILPLTLVIYIPIGIVMTILQPIVRAWDGL